MIMKQVSNELLEKVHKENRLKKVASMLLFPHS